MAISDKKLVLGLEHCLFPQKNKKGTIPISTKMYFGEQAFLPIIVWEPCSVQI